MPKQTKWNQYEAAVLLDAYLKTLIPGSSFSEIVEDTSKKLRLMAINNGLVIDDTYRNINGITFQMYSMESAYLGYKKRILATQLFTDIVRIYRENREIYDEWLIEAKNMAGLKRDNEIAFKSWLSENASSVQILELCSAFADIEQQAKKMKLIRNSLYDNLDSVTVKKLKTNIEQSKIFKFTHKRQWGQILLALKYLLQYSNTRSIGIATTTQSVGEIGSVSVPEATNSELKEKTSDGLQSAAVITNNKNAKESSSNIVTGTVKTIDFNNLQSMAFTKPTLLSYFGNEKKETSWKSLYVDACCFLLEEYPDMFDSMKSESLFSAGKTWLVDEQHISLLAVPKKVADGFYVETNRSASDLVKNLKWLLDKCFVDYENVVITYISRDELTHGLQKASSYERTESRYIRKDKEIFYRWLRDDQHMAEKTCRSYVSSIRRAEKFAEERRLLSTRLFTDDIAEAKATAKALFSDEKFVKYNSDQHNRFSAAINKLLQHIGAKMPKKVVASIDGESNEQTIVSAETNSEIIAVLKQHYEYGFKYDSIRETMRFRQFADEMGIVLPEDDEELKTIIISSGTIIDGKVYCTSNDMSQELNRMIDGIFSSGASIIYYESLWEREHEWMEAHVITSPDMLKEYLQKNITGCSFSKRFIIKGSRCTEKEAVTNELKRIWGIHPLESVNNLHDRLPYIPLDNIWRVISGNNFFVRVSDGEYLFIERFRITKVEEEEILEFVNTTCEENGFASIIDIPLGNIEEQNYEIPRLAIYNAIYKRTLSDIYILKGKILTRERSELDAVALLKQYIRDKDECTFDEVADKVVELTGGTNRQYAFQALYDDMVRVDKNRFIANRFVKFSVEEIDDVLSGFILDNFSSIRDITTFAMFPICGQSWNHYLLESFCYKYSRKYSLRIIHFNNKNAGIIAEKDYNKTYDEMLAIALARTDIELSLVSVGQYLFNTGYMAKRKYAKLGEITQQALEIRKER